MGGEHLWGGGGQVPWAVKEPQGVQRGLASDLGHRTSPTKKAQSAQPPKPLSVPARPSGSSLRTTFLGTESAMGVLAGQGGESHRLLTPPPRQAAGCSLCQACAGGGFQISYWTKHTTLKKTQTTAETRIDDMTLLPEKDQRHHRACVSCASWALSMLHGPCSLHERLQQSGEDPLTM